MQQRLVELLTNKDMLLVNQQYQTDGAKFAGGRVGSSPPARELWAKPLPGKAAAVLLFNRGGVVIGTTPAGADAPPAHCTDPESTLPPCHGCFVNDDRPWLAPCDDNVTASTGAQKLSFSTDQLPRAWLASSAADAAGDGDRAAKALECDVFDIFATPNKVKKLGRFLSWSALVPPHGSRFLRLSNCK